MTELIPPHEMGRLAYEIDTLARRIGHRFVLDENKLKALGYDDADLDEISCVYEFPRTLSSDNGTNTGAKK